MLDPRLLAEMDAFEQAQSPPPPARRPASPSPDAPPSQAGGVVSFVHASTPQGPVQPLPLSAVPTIAVAPVAPEEARRSPERPALRGSGEIDPLPSDKPVRRASGEFDPVESDFFAREAELYEENTPGDRDSGEVPPPGAHRDGDRRPR